MDSRFILTLTLILATAASVGKSAIVGGTETLEGEFPEVFAIVSPLIGTGKIQLCTGTLIHPEVIVTAGHCIPTDPKAVVTVFPDNSARIQVEGTKALRFKAHPDYDAEDPDLETSGTDVGIIVLEKPLSATPAPLASILDLTDRELARTDGLTVVGYGGKNSLALDETTGIKRHGITRAYGLSDTFVITKGTTAAISHGDSGGPAFLVDKKGERRLFGIASSSPDPKPGKPLLSFYAGVRPEIIAWIEKESGKKISESQNSEPGFGSL